MSLSIQKVLPLAVLIYACVGTDDISIEISVDAPDDYIRGAVFELRALYGAEGAEQQVEIDDRVLESDASFVVGLPRRDQGVLRAVVAELRHPKYRSSTVIVGADEISVSPGIVLRPNRWTTNDRNMLIKPAYETSVAAAEHLDWIREVYFERPEWLLVNEAFQKDRRLVSMLAYGGGGKEGDWETVRLANIEQWKHLKTIMDARSYRPCPQGYEFEGFVDRPCGAEKLNITYYERDAGRAAAAEEDEQLRQIGHARADLAQRLQVDKSEVRFGGYQNEYYDPARAGCPDAGEPAESTEQLGYLMVFSAGPRGSFTYYGKRGELPFFCRQKT